MTETGNHEESRTSNDSTTSLNIVGNQGDTVGFLRRLSAFLLDTTFLAVSGMIIGALFFEILAALGHYGRWAGYALVVAYWKGNKKGQTFGKRLMGLSVTDSHDNPLPTGRTLLRGAILWLPFFLYGLYPSSGTFVEETAIVLGVAGAGGGILYLSLFNRRTGQSLHDILSRSRVINWKGESNKIALPVWKGHIVVTVAWCVLLVTFTWTHSPSSLKQGLAFDLKTLSNYIVTLDGVRSATLNIRQSPNGPEVPTFLQVNVEIERTVTNAEKFSDNIAEAIINISPSSLCTDRLIILLRYGYDIGIASSWKNIEFNRSLTEWQGRVSSESPQSL